MTHLGLFEGIGGFSLAARWMGWETVAWCEWDEFCQQVLIKNFPEIKGRHGDITKTDFTQYAGRIDVLTGGFPCQPFSTAGKRKGTEDPRHLWPEMLRVIREIQPSIVVGENVYGLLNWSGGLVFEQVQIDLENEGYSVTPFILPASGVNAPHKRDRVWFIAHSGSNGHREGFNQNRRKKSQSKGVKIKRERVRVKPQGTCIERTITNPQRFGQQRQGGAERQMRSEANADWIPNSFWK